MLTTHAERKTWAENRGARSQESSFSNLADMEFVFRVKLDCRHWLISSGIEGQRRRFRRAEFLEVAAGVAQAEVVGVGRPVAPGLLVRRGGDSNGSLAAALVTFELCQDVERIGVHERIRPALGGGPDLGEEFVRGVVILLPPVQFGQGRQSRKFFFDAIDGAGACEGMVQALDSGGQVTYT